MTDIDLTALRHQLHRAAEPSGEEKKTRDLLVEVLSTLGGALEIHPLGATGLVVLRRGRTHGPVVLLRSDMDALPIEETGLVEYRSATLGVSHLCGHDGHMAILLGVAARLATAPPARGTVLLVFQPAEETGAGARAMLEDPFFASRSVDVALALHNLPGFPMGSVVLREGVFASASTGITVDLAGTTSHAAEPHLGHSPALAVAELITGISALPQYEGGLFDHAKATIIHARVGAPAFGTSPGEGTVMATLRSDEPPLLSRMTARVETLAAHAAAAHGLTAKVGLVEPFPVTVNHPDVVAKIREACEVLHVPVIVPATPFPWSEDFGHFTAASPGALIGLGAGEACPALHSPGYDFPDALLERGVTLFMTILEQLTGGAHARGLGD